MKFQVELTNLAKAKNDIKNGLVKETNKVIKSSLANINTEVKLLTEQLMRSSKFFNEMISGDLRGHFGIPESEIGNTVDIIIDEIVENIELFYTNLNISGNNIRGGLKIGIGRNGFDSLLKLKEASVVTEEGDKLPWLEWVLTRGDSIIVSEHDIMFKVSDNSRSGIAIMVPNRVASWRVPAEFSGDEKDNVITREILRHVNTYSRLISRLVNKQVKNSLS